MITLLGVALAGIQLAAPSGPEVGVDVVVTVTDDAEHPLPGQTVRVVHRPGLAGEHEQAVGITDADGRVTWSPATAGLARIRAGDRYETTNIRGPFPAFTLISALSLFLACIGALGWGLRAGAWRRR